MVKMKSECDLHWHAYLVMVLLLGIAFGLIMDKMKAMKAWQRKLFATTLTIYVFIAGFKQYVPMKLMSTTGNPRDSSVRGSPR